MLSPPYNSPQSPANYTDSMANLIREYRYYTDGLESGPMSDNVYPVIFYHCRNLWDELSDGQREVARYLHRQLNKEPGGAIDLLHSHLGWERGELEVLLSDILPRLAD